MCGVSRIISTYSHTVFMRTIFTRFTKSQKNPSHARLANKVKRLKVSKAKYYAVKITLQNIINNHNRSYIASSYQNEDYIDLKM